MFNLPKNSQSKTRALTSSPPSRLPKYHRNFNELKGQATVDMVIQPGSTGYVRFQGSWWPARCEQQVTITRGELVAVVGHENITLLVEPVQWVESDRQLGKMAFA